MKQITNKDLVYSTGNYPQYFVIKDPEKENTYIYIENESLCCIPETNTAL